MRYHSKSAGDLRNLPIPVLAMRFKMFKSVHEREAKFRASLAGATLG